MNFLKSITAAALLATAISSGAMAAIDLAGALKDNSGATSGASASKFAVTPEMVNKALTADSDLINNDLIKTILVEASTEAYNAAHDLDGTAVGNEADFIRLLTAKISGGFEFATDLDLMSDMGGTAEDDRKAVSTSLAERLVAVLDLKDMDEAFAEKIGTQTDFATIRDLKVVLADGRTLSTLGDLAANPQNAVGARFLNTLRTDAGMRVAEHFSKKDGMVGLVKKAQKDTALQEMGTRVHQQGAASRDAEVADKDREIAVAKQALADYKTANDVKVAAIDALLPHYTQLSTAWAREVLPSGQPVIVARDIVQTYKNVASLVAGLKTRVANLTRGGTVAPTTSAAPSTTGVIPTAVPTLTNGLIATLGSGTGSGGMAGAAARRSGSASVTITSPSPSTSSTAPRTQLKGMEVSVVGSLPTAQQELYHAHRAANKDHTQALAAAKANTPV